jgi:hypothetical protein
MGETRRTVPIVKQHSVLDYDGTDLGNSKHKVGIIGKIGTQTYRELMVAALADSWQSNEYQLKAAYLEFSMGVAIMHASVSGVSNTDPGASPNLSIRALSTTFASEGGHSPESWGPQANPDWGTQPGPGVSTTETATPDTGYGARRINVSALIEDVMPATIKKRNGDPGGAQTHYGWRLYATAEATASNRLTIRTIRHQEARYHPFLTLIFYDNVPPGVPTVEDPEPGGDPTIVDSADGRTLTVEFTSTIREGDTTDRVELEVYQDGATADESDPGVQTVTGTRHATTGPIVPTPTGLANRYKVTLLLPSGTQRTEMLYRLRVRNQKNTWGRWTELEEGRIQTAYTPGVPLDPRMTTDPQRPVISATLNSQDPADYVTGITGTFVRHNTDGTTTNLWPSIRVEAIGGTTTRPEIDWRGVGLNDGDVVSWTVTLYNRDEVASPPTAEQTTVMQTDVGPTFDPADATEALQSRTGPITINDTAEFDAYQYRIYVNDVLKYTSSVIGSGPDDTAEITLPSGYLNWGDTFQIEAETRPTGETLFGPTSPRVTLYINTLPSVGDWYASDGEGFVGSVIPTENVIWHSEYDDPDAARYGEVPFRKELELREYNVVPASGDLLDRRVGIADLKAIPEDEETGRQLMALTDATGWVAGTNVSAGTVASAPTLYTGNSLRLTFAASSTDRGARYTFSEPLDLSGYSSGTDFQLWRRVSSSTNLTDIRLRLETTVSDWAEWQFFPNGSVTLNSWVSRVPGLGDPDATAGTFDWSDIVSVYVWADVTGSYSGTVDLRDWFVGLAPYASVPPDYTYAMEFENSYNARVRYSDEGDALVSTTLAASASGGATNIKVTSVTGLVVGQDITLGSDAYADQETRTITVVGTAGSGGTGVTLDDAIFYEHASLSDVRILPWGPWSPWLTVKVSEPPAVVATGPADAATVTDPTQDFTFTFTSPASKAKATHTWNLYVREDGEDRLVYELDETGTGLTATAPFFLLEDGLTYAWEVVAYDTEGLYGTTTRRTFTTDFATPAAVTDLVATPDPASGTVTLTWTASVDAQFYVIRQLDADGNWARVDVGPRVLDDDRVPVTDETITLRTPTLGVNVFQVIAHSGALESEPADVETTLYPGRAGAWMLVVDDDRGLAWPVDASEAGRQWTGTVEEFDPPGNPYGVTYHWGTGARRTSLRFRYIPSEDGPLTRGLAALYNAGTALYIKAPAGSDYGTMRSKIVRLGPETPLRGGFVDLSVDLREIAPEAPA